MDVKHIIRYSLIFIILLVVQVVVLNHINIGTHGISPFFYILFILLIPFEIPKWLTLVLAFVLGIFVDIFNNSLAIHTSASLFITLLRPAVLNILSPRNGYEPGTRPRTQDLGFFWFLKYALLMILLHNIFYFILEAFTFQNIYITLLKIIFTTIFTTILILISQFISFKEKS